MESNSSNSSSSSDEERVIVAAVLARRRFYAMALVTGRGNRQQPTGPREHETRKYLQKQVVHRVVYRLDVMSFNVLLHKIVPMIETRDV